MKIITSFFKRVLTPVNVSKAIVIFLVGFMSRYLINSYFDINVFTEYLTLVSITFYSVFATFIVFIHELFTFFNINIIPNVIWNIFSKLGIGLKWLFVEPFIWVYSITWGKNPPIFYMNDPRTSTGNNSIYVGNNNHHYSLRRVGNLDSYYNEIAQQNPYTVEYFTINRIPHPSHYYNPDYSTQTFSDEYVSHNVSQYSQASNSQEESKFFYVDTINENGLDRYLYTPSNAPGAPAMSNITTPSTMTPLFGSTEQVNQNSNQTSTASLAFTNSTTHGTIGVNRSEDHINWPARRHELFRSMQVEAQFLKEEIRVPSREVKGRVSLGIEYVESKSNIRSLYVKYHDLTKRKFFWKIWEKNHGNYDSYEEFKKNFDPKMNIWKEIAKATRSDLSKDVQKLLDTNPFGTKNHTVTSRDIRKVSYSSAQKHLNEINARKYNSTKVSRK